MATKTAVSDAFVLSRRMTRVRQFAALHPKKVSSAQSICQSLEQANQHSLWISDDKALTDVLLKLVSGCPRSLGNMVLLHRPSLASLPILSQYFRHVAFGLDGGFLPSEELAEVLGAANKSDLFIGGLVDDDSETLTLWRGNFETLTVPFSALAPSGDGIAPNLSAFSVTDYGHTVKLGEYEAATDAILYEFDPQYRRRIARERRQAERSFGASLRRLRKQRGLRREDFSPLAPKTIARIEQGAVDSSRIHPRTLSIIAKKLAVESDEIATY